MRLVSILSSGVQAHCSGALLLPDIRTLLVADLHLGYSWAQRRRGELGPLADERTAAKLVGVCEELNPQRIVFVGDLVHAPKPCDPERAWIEQLLLQLSERAELIAVRGNHDRGFRRDFANLPLQSMDSWSSDSVCAVHGDVLPKAVPDGQILVLGHLHPSLCVRDAAGAGQRVPVFLSGHDCILLPAFSPFARGYDVLCGLPAEWMTLLGPGEVQTFLASTSRVVPAGPLRAVVDRIIAGYGSSPGSFRRAGPRKA